MIIIPRRWIKMVEIREAESSELAALIPVYKEAYQEHLIFKKKTDADIIEYMQKAHADAAADGGGFIIALLNDEVVGGLLLRKSLQGDSHSRWKIRHVAVMEKYRDQDIGTELLQAAEQKLVELIKKGDFITAKAEVSVAEGEKEAVDFYEKAGFKLEGTRADHYRLGENVYLLGKTIGIQQ
ncbi:GNAT family N-acetyltransferase [Candidatus Woesearchaeota archaeon]|nr:GNAT family N-acetyltransferase [Candidatus Woesearchaeota archaeon]